MITALMDDSVISRLIFDEANSLWTRQNLPESASDASTGSTSVNVPSGEVISGCSEMEKKGHCHRNQLFFKHTQSAPRTYLEMLFKFKRTVQSGLASFKFAKCSYLI